MRPVSVAFVGSTSGTWTVDGMEAVRGPALAPASHVEVIEGLAADAPVGAVSWVLRGVTSNERYLTRVERDALAARPPFPSGLNPVRASASANDRPTDTGNSHHPTRSVAQWHRLLRRPRGDGCGLTVGGRGRDPVGGFVQSSQPGEDRQGQDRGQA